LRCSNEVCVANQIDESTYEAKHVSATCKCDHIGPPIDEIINIIEDNGIPLITISAETKTSAVKLRVEHFRKDNEYYHLSCLV
jgi:hypothetical protein